MTKFLVCLLVPVLAALVMGCSSKPLTDDMKRKLDPALQRLLEGQSAAESDYDRTTRPDGGIEYSVILRGSSPEDVRALGIHLNSVFGEVMTARMTVDEIRRVSALKSVSSIRTGDKPRTLP